MEQNLINELKALGFVEVGEEYEKTYPILSPTGEKYKFVCYRKDGKSFIKDDGSLISHYRITFGENVEKIVYSNLNLYGLALEENNLVIDISNTPVLYGMDALLRALLDYEKIFTALSL